MVEVIRVSKSIQEYTRCPNYVHYILTSSSRLALYRMRHLTTSMWPFWLAAWRAVCRLNCTSTEHIPCFNTSSTFTTSPLAAPFTSSSTGLDAWCISNMWRNSRETFSMRIGSGEREREQRERERAKGGRRETEGGREHHLPLECGMYTFVCVECMNCEPTAGAGGERNTI